MAEYAFPTTAHNTRAVTEREYEDLTHPQAPDGLVGTPNLPALVYADGTLLGFKVRANRAALVRGYRWEAGTTERTVSLTAPPTPGTTRIDLVVLRLTRNPWDIDLVVVPGTATTTPTAPSPTYGSDTSTGVWELPLAAVTVPAGATNTSAEQCAPLAWYVGDDGQLLFTTSTRPPHHPGRAGYETTTSRWLVSNGTQWLVGMDDSGPVAVTPSTGWDTAFSGGNLTVRRTNGTVHLDFVVRRIAGAVAANVDSLMCVLPSGFWPGVDCYGSTLGYNGPILFSVDTSGRFVFSTHGGLGGVPTYGSISFPAA